MSAELILSQLSHESLIKPAPTLPAVSAPKIFGRKTTLLQSIVSAFRQFLHQQYDYNISDPESLVHLILCSTSPL